MVATISQHAQDLDAIELLTAARRAQGLSRRQVWLLTQINPHRIFRLEHRISQPRPHEIDALFAALFPAEEAK